MSPGETDGLDDADQPQWSNSELDEWFEHDFGGEDAFHWYFVNEHGSRTFHFPNGASRVTAEEHPDLHFGITAYRQLQRGTYYGPATRGNGVIDGEAQPWPLLSQEAKTRFRRGWENAQGTPELAAVDLEPVVFLGAPDAQPRREDSPAAAVSEPAMSAPRRVWNWLEDTSTITRLAAIAVSVVGAVLITLAVQSGDGTPEIDGAGDEPPAEVVAGDDDLVADPPAVAADEPAVAVDEPEVVVDEPAVAVDEPEVVVDEPAVAVDEPEVEVDEPTNTLETLIGDAVNDAFIGENWVLDPLTTPPLLRTSFLAEPQPAEFFEDALGAVFPITHVNVMTLDVEAGPGGLPLSELFEAISPRVDVALEPGTDNSEPGADLLAIGFRIEGDLTDPAVCAGTLLNLVVNVHVPDFGDQYVANPSFPGEYYAGGNVFVNVSLVDCVPEHFADGYFGGEIAGGLRPEDAAFLAVNDGATYGLVVMPSPYVDPDGTVRFIFFEHPEGENFVPENTRYQSVTDTFDPPIRVAMADTVDFDAVIFGPGAGE